MLKVPSNDKAAACATLGNTQCCPPTDELYFLNILCASKVTVLCSLDLLCLLTYVTENIQVAESLWEPRQGAACWLALV
jgi:hypothetical protein